VSLISKAFAPASILATDKRIIKRDYEENTLKRTVKMIEALYKKLTAHDPRWELQYNKRYIGLAHGAVVRDVIQFWPKQNLVKLRFRLEQSPDLEKEMEQAGLDVTGYDAKRREYWVRTTRKEFPNQKILFEILGRAYDYTKV
jgi:hypothetical protein